ncbi:putative bifunctional diguanylate cyclase/phosphodiesterase [Billgrantia kenyensis]|uniref:cyclic-guanylate-specific phosphodiesterase n=1 Tax=Billgrantia kenyensis TaxID=321266 RepID=A0A7V9VY48_9GAMM|nr:GGDEF domain-containing phosphodiesterase [Halomonas kenyensis]MBA2777584.1 EAL domain-containing protein [Halomonas kenyensis]MCG6660254.1 EAL domain-containing protein [Halomonas kenyensis]
MKPSRPLLWVFLLPTLVVLIPALVFGFSAVQILKERVSHNHTRQLEDLSALHQAADYEQSLGELHQSVIDMLQQADLGELSSLASYRLHSAFVNELAALGRQVQELTETQLMVDLNHGSAQRLLEAFEAYRRFIVMASDIATVDPTQAQHYLDEAQHEFLRFTMLTGHLSARLSERAQVRTEDSYRTIHDHLNTVTLLGVFTLLLMLLAAFYSARVLNRHLLTIGDALLSLSRLRREAPELPRIQRLAEQGRGQLRQIARAVLRLRESEARRLAAERKAHQLTHYDGLTELPNWRMMSEHLEHSLQLCQRTGQYGALIYLDLDLFQQINDSYGHRTGDRLLREVADRLRGFQKERCIPGRPGGDEFLLVIDSLPAQADSAATRVEELADRIRLAIAEPFTIDGIQHFLSASQGVAMFHGSDDIETLFKLADAACHQAKLAGRDTIRFHDDAIQSVMEARNETKRDLRLALQRGEFRLVYQLQYDAGRRPLGAEALVRWQHPSRGLVSPAEFIPLAEESGLIVPLGDWVLEQACRQLVAWKQQPASPPLALAVNVSARQFKEPDFVERIERVLDATGADPHRLKLELTESSLIDDFEAGIDKMQRLKALGISFAMDDFGTGYSSLQYLRRLPLDQIKIDQSFVNDMLASSDGLVIVRTIIAMGLALQLEVVAEGVETEAQLKSLIAEGCHAFQGYYFCRPMPVDQLQALLAPAAVN